MFRGFLCCQCNEVYNELLFAKWYGFGCKPMSSLRPCSVEVRIFGPANVNLMSFGAIQLRCYDFLGRPRSTLSLLGLFSVDVRVSGTSQCRPYGFWIDSLSMRRFLESVNVDIVTPGCSQ